MKPLESFLDKRKWFFRKIIQAFKFNLFSYLTMTIYFCIQLEISSLPIKYCPICFISSVSNFILISFMLMMDFLMS